MRLQNTQSGGTDILDGVAFFQYDVQIRQQIAFVFLVGYIDKELVEDGFAICPYCEKEVEIRVGD